MASLLNTKKRLVKAPKVYLRDTGIMHALLGIHDREALYGHPNAGGRWEGFVIENLTALSPDQTIASFYRTSAGAEIDLVLELPDGEIWAMEIKSGRSASPSRGFYNACEDVQPNRSFVVYAGEERYPLSQDVEAIGVLEMAREILNASTV